jgi:hypothetical protein
MISPSTTVNAYCGYKINVDKYKKTISKRKYVSASEEDVVMTKNDKTINLYYTKEGEIVYEN